MTHEQAIERLDDFASGELPDLERVRVQRHLDGCGECRAEMEAIRALLDEVSALPPGIAPPADLWAGIEARLEPRAAGAAVFDEPRVIPFAPRRRVWEPPRWALQLAAALVLVAGSSLITARVMRQQQGTPAGPAVLGPVAVTRPAATPASAVPARGTDAVPVANAAQPRPQPSNDVKFASNTTTPKPAAAPMSAYAAFRPAERDYQHAIDDLQKVLETKRGQMRPETVATLERNLGIIDAAIAESRAALEKDPNSRELTQMLSATYDAKVQALRQAVEL